MSMMHLIDTLDADPVNRSKLNLTIVWCQLFRGDKGDIIGRIAEGADAGKVVLPDRHSSRWDGEEYTSAFPAEGYAKIQIMDQREKVAFGKIAELCVHSWDSRVYTASNIPGRGFPSTFVEAPNLRKAEKALVVRKAELLGVVRADEQKRAKEKEELEKERMDAQLTATQWSRPWADPDSWDSI